MIRTYFPLILYFALYEIVYIDKNFPATSPKSTLPVRVSHTALLVLCNLNFIWAWSAIKQIRQRQIFQRGAPTPSSGGRCRYRCTPSNYTVRWMRSRQLLTASSPPACHVAPPLIAQYLSRALSWRRDAHPLTLFNIAGTPFFSAFPDDAICSLFAAG